MVLGASSAAVEHSGIKDLHQVILLSKALLVCGPVFTFQSHSCHSEGLINMDAFFSRPCFKHCNWGIIFIGDIFFRRVGKVDLQPLAKITS